MMPPTRRSTAAVTTAWLLAAAVVLMGAADAVNVNGGRNCRYYSIRKINTLMRQNGITNATLINNAINSAKNVNNYLCASCDPTRMQIQNVGVVVADRGECWCQPGFGWSQTVKNNTNGVPSYKNLYGCSACPSGTTTAPTSGPYRPGSLRPGTLNRWTNTACA